MLKFRLVFLFVLLLSGAYAQVKPGTIYPPGKPGVDYNLLDKKGKRHGLWIQQWKDTRNLNYKGEYRNGVPYGSAERYYPDGTLMAAVTYVQDTTIMDVVFFHPDGKTKMSEGRFQKRKKEGNWKLWDESGKLLSDENFHDSLLTGNCKYFFPTGQLLRAVTYNAGKMDGPASEYFDNGKKRSEANYSKGLLDGPYKAWFENGILDCEGKYSKGLQDGQWYFNNPDGPPKLTILFKKGKEVKRKYENGTFKEFYESGEIPKSEYTYENGMKNGPFTEWYEKGAYADAPVTEADRQAGIAQRQTLQGTQVKMKGDYVNDKLEGEITYYLGSGGIEKVEEWSDGQLVKTRVLHK